MTSLNFAARHPLYFALGEVKLRRDARPSLTALYAGETPALLENAVVELLAAPVGGGLDVGDYERVRLVGLGT